MCDLCCLSDTSSAAYVTVYAICMLHSYVNLELGYTSKKTVRAFFKSLILRFFYRFLRPQNTSTMPRFETQTLVIRSQIAKRSRTLLVQTFINWQLRTIKIFLLMEYRKSEVARLPNLLALPCAWRKLNFLDIRHPLRSTKLPGSFYAFA